MRAFNEFKNAPADFWAFIKFISEQLGYSKRRSGVVSKYTRNEIENLCRETGTFVDNNLVNAALAYTNMRADLLNDTVEHNLMNGETAKHYFENIYYPIHEKNHFF